MVTAYCFTCKEKGVKMKNPVLVKNAKGIFMGRGQCPECGQHLTVMMSKQKASDALNAGLIKMQRNP